MKTWSWALPQPGLIKNTVVKKDGGELDLTQGGRSGKHKPELDLLEQGGVGGSHMLIKRRSDSVLDNAMMGSGDCHHTGQYVMRPQSRYSCKS